MDRPLIMRAFPRATAWVGIIALGCTLALAQDASSSNITRSDGQIEMDVVHALDGSRVKERLDHRSDDSERGDALGDGVERFFETTGRVDREGRTGRHEGEQQPEGRQSRG